MTDNTIDSVFFITEYDGAEAVHASNDSHDNDWYTA